MSLSVESAPFYPRVLSEPFYPTSFNANVKTIEDSLAYVQQCIESTLPGHMIVNAVNQLESLVEAGNLKSFDLAAAHPAWLYVLDVCPRVVWAVNRDIRVIQPAFRDDIIKSDYFAADKNAALEKVDTTSTSQVNEFIHRYCATTEDKVKLFTKTRTHSVIKFMINRDKDGEMLKSYLSDKRNPSSEIYRVLKKNPHIFSTQARAHLG